jgi:hypothetical protein
MVACGGTPHSSTLTNQHINGALCRAYMPCGIKTITRHRAHNKKLSGLLPLGLQYLTATSTSLNNKAGQAYLDVNPYIITPLYTSCPTDLQHSLHPPTQKPAMTTHKHLTATLHLSLACGTAANPCAVGSSVLSTHTPAVEPIPGHKTCCGNIHNPQLLFRPLSLLLITHACQQVHARNTQQPC